MRFRIHQPRDVCWMNNWRKERRAVSTMRMRCGKVGPPPNLAWGVMMKQLLMVLFSAGSLPFFFTRPNFTCHSWDRAALPALEPWFNGAYPGDGTGKEASHCLPRESRASLHTGVGGLTPHGEGLHPTLGLRRSPLHMGWGVSLHTGMRWQGCESFGRPLRRSALGQHTG